MTTKTITQSLLCVTLVLGVNAVAAGSSYAAANCPFPQAIHRDGWTKLRNCFPEPRDRIIEGSYLGQGDTTRTEYQMHLIQYLSTSDEFVGVVYNEEKHTGAIGILKRQMAGTYLWYGIHATGGEASQLEPVFDGEPLFNFTVTFDDKGRTADIKAVSVNPNAGVEMISFTHARTSQLHRSPVRGQYMADFGGGKRFSATVGPTSDESPELEQGHCPDPGVAPGTSSSWKFQTTYFEGERGTSSQDFLARSEIPGVWSLRPTRYEGYVPHPQDAVTVVAVNVFRPGPFLAPDHETILYFQLDKNGFLTGRPVQALNAR